MDNHQWRLSQAYTYAYHLSIQISITLITYLSHILCLLHVNIFRYIFYVFGISFIYTFTIFLFLCFTYPILIMFISFYVRILCMYHILSYNLSYTVLYFYLQSHTFHIRYFCMLSSDTFHVLYFPMFSIYYTFHIPFSFIYFLYFTCSYPFRVLYFVLSIYYIHLLFSFPILFSCYIFIWLSLLCTCICCHIFSYDIHILCFSYTILFI